MQAFPRSADTIATINAPGDKVFFFLDDHKNLSAHMNKSSWMMLGSRMEIYLDAAGARSVGSKFGFKGAILGIPLSVDEVVTQREPSGRKVWETVGEPNLWVIGQYRMGLEIAPQGNSARLRVFIEYALPAAGLPRLLGLLFGNAYAHWCTTRMVGDAKRHFAKVGGF
ncbi:MAG: SRPBCC family protein [Cucumibacter sp.]